MATLTRIEYKSYLSKQGKLYYSRRGNRTCEDARGTYIDELARQSYVTLIVATAYYSDGSQREFTETSPGSLHRQIPGTID
jgi:hypothetical protein